MIDALPPAGPVDPTAGVAADEVQKSNLLLQAQLLRSQGQTDSAADLFAQAAQIEERLARARLQLGQREQAFAHQFSALSCWAQAGNWHLAITLGEQLLAEPDLGASLRAQVQDYTQLLRKRRAEWSAGIALAGAG